MRYLWLLPIALCAQTSSVGVQVRDANTHAPIAGVELKLTRNSVPKTSWSASTGADGNAAFDRLPTGNFTLETFQEGYIDSKVRGFSQSVVIQQGVANTEIQVMLAKSTSVQGRVLDEDGRPMAGVKVRAWAVEAQSDAEGSFLLQNLRDGKYPLDFEIPLELRRKTLVRDAASGAVTAYPAMEFYPGVASQVDAQTVSIAAGMNLHGFDVRLRRTQLADSTGQVLARPDEPLTGVQVELQTVNDTRLVDETLGSREVDADGRFGFEMIAPGPYVLLVYRGPNGSGLPYVVPVEVGRTGLRDKRVLVPEWQTIRGVLKVKDDAAWTGDIEVSVVSNRRGVANRYITLRRGGEFALQDVPPGEWQMGIVGAAVRTGDKRKLTITSARFGATDAIASPIRVVESGNPMLEIELSTDTGRIAGRLKAVPRETVMVMVERAGAVKRYIGFPGGRVNPDGSFLIEDLAPGTYEVRRLVGKPVLVEVKAGETTAVEVE